jgi:chromosome segregation ATPase
MEERFKILQHENGTLKEQIQTLGYQLSERNREFERIREQTVPRIQFQEVSDDREHVKRDLDKQHIRINELETELLTKEQIIQQSRALSDQLRDELQGSEARADDAIQKLSAQKKAFEVLRSQNEVTLEALRTANTKYEQALSIIESKDAYLKSREAEVENERLALKGRISEFQQQNEELSLQFQSQTETWQRLEAEHKTRERLLAERLKKQQKESQDTVTELQSRIETFEQGETVFRIREQQLNLDSIESKETIERLKAELRSKSDNLHQVETMLRSQEQIFAVKIRESEAKAEETLRDLRAKIEFTRATEIREQSLIEKLRKADELLEHTSAALRVSEENAYTLQTKCDQAAEDFRRQLLVQEEKVRQLSTELEMRDTAAESSARSVTALERQIALLTNELSDAKQQVSESQESIAQLKASTQKLHHLVESLEQYKSAHEENAGDLRRLKTLFEQQKQELSRNTREIVNVQKEYNEVLRRVQKEKQENAALASQLEAERKTSAAFSAVRSAVESLHSFLSQPKHSFRSAFSDLSTILEPIFTIFSFDPAQFAIENPIYQSDFCLVASIEPTDDPIQSKIEELRTELMKFPIDQPFVQHQNAEKNMSEQIADLRTMADLIHNLFRQKERDLDKMAQIIASQHQAVMKLTKTPGSFMHGPELERA